MHLVYGNECIIFFLNQWIQIFSSVTFSKLCFLFQILQLQMNDYKYHYLFTTFVSISKYLTEITSFLNIPQACDHTWKRQIWKTSSL
jgi:hypothetical protein